MMQTSLMTPPSNVIYYSKMQMQYMREALHDDPEEDHRWNIKSGATQCGKTTLDYMEVTPYRITVRMGLPGLVIFTGVSLGTIERNLLEPMREYWQSKGMPKAIGDRIKTDPAGNKYVMVLGQKVFLCGMVDKKAIARLRGSKFKYVYCDEIAEYNEEAFQLLKSRLSLSYSCMDGACNPEDPNHWLYKFIHSDIDIYLQEYTIFDNPFLSKKYVDALCAEYAGTVYYDRYILGKWVRAEGSIYRKFADNPQAFMLNDIPKMMKINIGIDWGGNGSWHSFSAVGFGLGYSFMVCLESEKIEGATSVDELEQHFVRFVKALVAKYTPYLPDAGFVFDAYCDSAMPAMIRCFQTVVVRESLPVRVKAARKMEIKQRIVIVCRAQGLKMFYVMPWNTNVIQAFSQAVYSKKEGHESERLDDATTNMYGVIDTLDSTEYAIEPEYKHLINALERGI